MPQSDLDEADRAALVSLLREPIADDHFPLSPRITRLRAILDKLDPPRLVETLRPPTPPGEPSLALRKKRRRWRFTFAYGY